MTSPTASPLRGLRLAVADRANRRLQGALCAGALATAAYAVALSIWAYGHGGPSLLAAVALATMLPAGLLAPLLGGLADRFLAERVLVAALVVRGGALGVLGLAVAAALPVWAVLLLAAAASLASRVVYPAQATLLPRVVEGPDRLAAANALSSCIENGASIAGPALAAAALSVAEPATVILLAGAGTLAAAATVRTIRGAGPPARTGAASGGPLDGLRAVRRDRHIRALVAVMGLHALAFGMLASLVVVLALDDLGEAGVGVLQAALAAGALVGGAGALRASTPVRRARGIVLGTGAAALLAAPLGATAGLILLVMLLVALGAAVTLADVAATTTLQTVCPPSLTGRVFGLVEGLAVGATAAGAALAPLIQSHAGATTATSVMGGVLAGAALLAGICDRAVLSASWPPLERLVGSFRATSDAPRRLPMITKRFARRPTTIAALAASALLAVGAASASAEPTGTAACNNGNIEALPPDTPNRNVGLSSDGGLYIGGPEKVAWQAELARWDGSQWVHANHGPWLITTVDSNGRGDVYEYGTGRRLIGVTSFPIQHGGYYRVYYHRYWFPTAQRGAVEDISWAASHVGVGSLGDYCLYNS